MLPGQCLETTVVAVTSVRLLWWARCISFFFAACCNLSCAVRIFLALPREDTLQGGQQQQHSQRLPEHPHQNCQPASASLVWWFDCIAAPSAIAWLSYLFDITVFQAVIRHIAVFPDLQRFAVMPLACIVSTSCTSRWLFQR